MVSAARLGWALAVFLCAALWLGAGAAWALRSGIDRSFGDGGVVDLRAGLAEDPTLATVTGMAAAPGGASYVLESQSLGCGRDTCSSNVLLRRFTAEGAPGTAFDGPSGAVLVKSGTEQASNVVADHRGRALVAVSRSRGVAVLRFRADGVLDPSFGRGGEALVECACSGMTLRLALAGKGRTLLEAERSAPGLGSAATLDLARLKADGSLDPGFGRSGQARVRLAGHGWTQGLAVRPGGAVFVSGWDCCTGGTTTTFVTRISQRGRLDGRYESRARRAIGRLREAIQEFIPGGRTVVLRPHGRLDLFGPTSRGHGWVLRLRPDGSLDPRFGHGGLRRLAFTVGAAALDAAGGTFVASESGTTAGVVTYRLLPSDRLDPEYRNGAAIPHSYGLGVAVATGPRRRALVLSSGLFICRQVCPPEPRLARFLEGPSAGRRR